MTHTKCSHFPPLSPCLFVCLPLPANAQMHGTPIDSHGKWPFNPHQSLQTSSMARIASTDAFSCRVYLIVGCKGRGMGKCFEKAGSWSTLLPQHSAARSRRVYGSSTRLGAPMVLGDCEINLVQVYAFLPEVHGEGKKSQVVRWLRSGSSTTSPPEKPGS